MANMCFMCVFWLCEHSLRVALILDHVNGTLQVGSSTFKNLSRGYWLCLWLQNWRKKTTGVNLLSLCSGNLDVNVTDVTNLKWSTFSIWDLVFTCSYSILGGSILLPSRKMTKFWTPIVGNNRFFLEPACIELF